jgi:hypothetical protein
MSFTSIDNVVNAISTNGTFIRLPFYKITGAGAYTASRGYSFFQLAGQPAAGSYSGTALTSVQMTSATQGALPLNAAVAPATRHLLNWGTVTGVATGVPSTLMLVDFLLYYPTVNANTTSPNTLTNSASLPRYTTGDGVMMMLEVTAALGATASNVTVSYTNQAGTASRTTPATAMTVSQIISGIGHTGVAPLHLPLQGTDSGVRSIQTITFSAAMGAGSAVSAVLYRPLATIPLTTIGVMTERDFLYQLPSLPKIEDGACLGFLYFTGAATVASTPFTGYLDYAWN